MLKSERAFAGIPADRDYPGPALRMRNAKVQPDSTASPPTIRAPTPPRLHANPASIDATSEHKKARASHPVYNLNPFELKDSSLRRAQHHPRTKMKLCPNLKSKIGTSTHATAAHAARFALTRGRRIHDGRTA
jgi:hypothetical protein